VANYICNYVKVCMHS